MQYSATPPVPGAVLVLERRNSWVKVLDPQSGRTQWVDLAETSFESADSDPRSGDGSCGPTRG